MCRRCREASQWGTEAPFYLRGDNVICPKCNKEVKDLLALSRFSDQRVCSLCGNKEGIESMLRAGVITQEKYDELCSELEAVHKEHNIS